MPNTNPQVVSFSNTRVRPIADRLFSLRIEAHALLDEYNAGDIGTKINDAGAGELIVDGSAVDGRTPITGGDIFNLVTAVQAFIAYVENAAVATADRVSVITKPHVNRF